MVAREFPIKITVDADGAVRSLENVDRQLDEFTQSLDEASGRRGTGGTPALESAFSKLGAAVISLNQAWELGQRAVAAVTSGFQTLFSTLDEAQRIDGLTNSFDAFQEKLGRDSTEAIDRLRVATGGLVSDLELVELASTSAALGVDQGSDRFFELTEAAQKASIALGKDFGEAVAVINQGIGRLSPQVLDNLGVVVKLGDVYEKAAAEIGKTTEQLTQQEKQTALINETLRQLNENFGDVSLNAQTAGQAAGLVQVAYKNLTDQFVAAFGESEELRDSLVSLARSLNEVDVETVAAGFGLLASAVIEVTAAVADLVGVLSRLPQNFSFIRDFARSGAFLTVSEQAAKLSGQVQALLAFAPKTEDSFKKLVGVFNELTRELNESNSVTGISVKAYESLRERVEEFRTAIQEAQGEVRKTSEELDSNTESVDRATSEWEKFVKQLDIAAGIGGVPDLVEEITALNVELDTGVITQREYSIQLGNIAANAKASKKSYEEFIESLKVSRATIKNVSDDLDRLFEESAELFELGPESGQNPTDLGGFIVDQLGLDSEVGSVVASGVNKIGSQIVSGFQNGFGSNEAKQIGGTITQTVGTALAASGNPLGIALSAFGPSLVDGLVDSIGDAFGGKTDAQANAREAFEGFLIDAFSAVNAQSVINGELVKLADLVDFDRDFFDSDEDGQGFSFFNSLADDVREAFAGVGIGLSEILEDPENLGAQFGAELATGFEGSLFALRGAVDALGLSFEDLGQAIIQSAKQGEISFLEAESALRGLGTLAQDGIPGQIGAVTEAFNALKQAGVTGGATTIQAFKAVGTELTELGANTIPEIEAALTDLGFSSEDTSKFIEALGEVGITSAQQIADATDRLAIQALADLESQAFAFAESFEDSTQNLIDQLNNIPEEINSRVIIDVETRAADSGAQQVIDSGALGEGLRG